MGFFLTLLLVLLIGCGGSSASKDGQNDGLSGGGSDAPTCESGDCSDNPDPDPDPESDDPDPDPNAGPNPDPDPGAGDPDPDPEENDSDADGIMDDVDNCPDVANADQVDLDGDGVGHLCECDDLHPITNAEMMGRQFIIDKLMTPEGGVWSNLNDNHPNDPDIGVNHEILTESMGHLLLYAYYSRNKNLFDQTLQFIIDYHVSDTGLLYWNLESSYTPIHNEGAPGEYANTSIDDLRIIKGLMLGHQCWGDANYKNFAVNLGAVLKENILIANIVSQATIWGDSWGGWIVADDLAILSYPDVKAMQFLENEVGGWQTIIDATVNMQVSGAIGNGLYEHKYDIPNTTYLQQDELEMIHELWTALRLAQAGETVHAQTTLDLIKDEFTNDGQISGEYNRNGAPSVDWEMLSVYAVAARLAYELGDTVLYNDIIDYLLTRQITDPAVETYGAFLWGADDRVWAFGQLNTLIVLAHRRNLQF